MFRLASYVVWWNLPSCDIFRLAVYVTGVFRLVGMMTYSIWLERWYFFSSE
jgi:hypothetical protein